MNAKTYMKIIPRQMLRNHRSGLRMREKHGGLFKISRNHWTLLYLLEHVRSHVGVSVCEGLYEPLKWWESNILLSNACNPPVTSHGHPVLSLVTLPPLLGHRHGRPATTFLPHGTVTWTDLTFTPQGHKQPWLKSSSTGDTVKFIYCFVRYLVAYWLRIKYLNTWPPCQQDSSKQR